MDPLSKLLQELTPLLALHGWQRGPLGTAAYLPGNRWRVDSTIPPVGFPVYLTFYGGRGRNVLDVLLSPGQPRAYPDTDVVSVRQERLRREGAGAVLLALRQIRQARSQAGKLAEALANPTADPLVLLQYLQTSDRKFRLIGCALSRMLSPDDRNEEAIRAAELYADEKVPKRVLKKARKAANLPWLDSYEPWEEAFASVRLAGQRFLAEGRQQVTHLIRDIAVAPLVKPLIRHSWLRGNGGQAEQVAQAIYDSGNFDDLPVLADALEEAGCTHAPVLDHFRFGGPHARGCWALDALLDKE